MGKTKEKGKRIIRTNLQFVFFVVLAFFAMFLVSYIFTGNIVRAQMVERGKNVLDRMVLEVSNSLKHTEAIFAYVSKPLPKMIDENKPNKDILDYLTDETSHSLNNTDSGLDGFLKIYGFINDEFLDGSGWDPWDPPTDPPYVPSSRPWYIGAVSGVENLGDIYFSKPYLDAETGGMCISFSRAILSADNDFAGVLAIDLKLTSITDKVKNSKITGNGYGVVINDSGSETDGKMSFTIHPNNEFIGSDISVAGDGYSELVDLLENGQEISAFRFTDSDGTSSIAFFDTIFEGWHIGIITPRYSYYRDVNILGWVIGGLGLTLAAVLSYVLVRLRMQKLRSDEESLSKSTFLARMSHEMRTPMNAVIGITNIAKNYDDIEKIKLSLDKIGEASVHLLGVINDVLDMSKIEAGKLELYISEFSLDKMIAQVESVMNYKIAERQQNFTINIAPNVPKVIFSDSQRLAQVITNLLSNASKFTDNGGKIELNISRLDSGGEQSGKSVLRFSVTDNGIGISAEQQSKLFKSFEQADGSISRKYGGTGLGLAISKRIVNLMGGDVGINSEPGKGSEFYFTICADIGVYMPMEEKADDLNESTDGLFNGRHILLAEDIELNREILIESLESTGVKFDSAENGAQACELFSKNPDKYDMIFMDIHMPEVDGLEATRRIRAMDLQRAKTIPIIAMTASVFKEDIDNCKAAGMDDHTGKPIDLNDVIGKIKKYCVRGRG